jgi:hypothetical protein
MRRLAPGVLIAGLVALIVAATVDGLRGTETPPAPRPTAAVLPDAWVEAAAALRAAGARGTLTWSDRRCRLHALRLPGLEPVSAPGYTACEPHIPTGGLGLRDGAVVWSGLGFQTARVVLSPRDLSAAVQRDPQTAALALAGAGRYEATQLVALGDGRFGVVLVHKRFPWERPFAVFEGTRLVRLRVGLVGQDDVVRPSPAGTYFALVRPREVQIFATDGGAVDLPSATLPHAVAWSPDDRWTALATRYSVYVFPSRRSDETIRIPLPVRDLDWGP